MKAVDAPGWTQAKPAGTRKGLRTAFHAPAFCTRGADRSHPRVSESSPRRPAYVREGPGHRRLNELHKAEEVRLTLVKLQKDYLIDLEDAVAVTKDANGNIKLHQAVNLTAAGAVSGGFWGTLIGLIFLNPLLGLAIGASAGAVSGALSDVGINDQFMKDLAATMQPNSSALFVLVRKSTPDKVLEEVKGTGGTVLKTSLSHEDEAKLQAALSPAKA